MERPKCKRCKKPLDLFPDEDGKYQWTCNNPKLLVPDEEFFKFWDNLPGDDIVRLSKEM
jgi:hypothetical protein